MNNALSITQRPLLSLLKKGTFYSKIMTETPGLICVSERSLPLAWEVWAVEAAAKVGTWRQELEKKSGLVVFCDA